MARPESLAPGNCYFMVGYHDRDLLFPFVETLRYLRCEEVEGLGRRWLFDYPSDAPEECTETTPQSEILALPADQLHQVVDFDGLSVRLREMSRQHPLTAIPAREVEYASELPSDVQANVDRFFADSSCSCLVMTIRFTDDAISLSRAKDGYTVDFITRPFQKSDEEEKIRRFFSPRNVLPCTDYLADKGRTRILDFPISEDRGETLELLRLLFLSIYSLRADDELDYTFLDRVGEKA
jgi:hypothetical protein